MVMRATRSRFSYRTSRNSKDAAGRLSNGRIGLPPDGDGITSLPPSRRTLGHSEPGLERGAIAHPGENEIGEETSDVVDLQRAPRAIPARQPVDGAEQREPREMHRGRIGIGASAAREDPAQTLLEAVALGDDAPA